MAFSRTSVAPATACSPGDVPGFPRPETRSWRVRTVRELSPFGTVLFRSYQQALSGLSSLSCSPFRLSRNRRGVSSPRTRASPHACSRRWPRLLGHGGFRRCSPFELHAAPLEGFEPASSRFAPIYDGQPADRRLRVFRQVCPRRPDSSGNNHEVEARDCPRWSRHYSEQPFSNPACMSPCTGLYGSTRSARVSVAGGQAASLHRAGGPA